MTRPTRAFVLATGGRIAPFGDAPGEALVVNKPLARVQREALADCGIPHVEPVASAAGLPAPGPETGGGYLVIADDLFVSRSLLRAFLAESDAVPGEVVRLALGDCRFLADSAPLQDLVRERADGSGWAGYPAWIVREASGRTRLDDAPVAVIDAQEELKKIEGVPRVFAADREITFPLTARVAIRLQSWVHVLRANQLAMMAGLASLKERSKLRNLLAILWILLKSFPPSEARVLRAISRKGRRTKIHPTAVVEASLLGDGVRIGAHAVVRASVLDDGAVVEDFGLVEMSVLGKGACVTKKAISNFNVMYPGSVLGHAGAQMSLLGYDAFVSTDSRIFDLKFDGNVPVEHRGKTVSSGARFLGACVGHRASVGAGVFVQFGKAIPNGAVIVKHPREVVRKIDPGVPERVPLAVENGRAVPIGKGIRRTTERGLDRAKGQAAADAVAEAVAAPTRSSGGESGGEGSAA